jgi:hypothetical protein
LLVLPEIIFLSTRLSGINRRFTPISLNNSAFIHSSVNNRPVTVSSTDDQFLRDYTEKAVVARFLPQLIVISTRLSQNNRY